VSTLLRVDRKQKYFMIGRGAKKHNKCFEITVFKSPLNSYTSRCDNCITLGTGGRTCLIGESDRK
jgi:hypothetical protein